MPSLRHWPVVLYIPNLIGYVRIILSAIAFADFTNVWKFFVYYSIGFVLDAADGLAARKLDQSSHLGAQLDMLTDRCATAALLAILAVLYPHAAPLCYALIFLDGYSHWMQMVAGACAGTASHKQASRGFLLNLYYRRPVLTFVCSLNEMCLLALYLRAFPHDERTIFALGGVRLVDAVLYAAAPVCLLKQVISLRQIASAHATITDSV